MTASENALTIPLAAVGQPAGRVYVYTAPGYDTDWTRTVGSVSTSGHGRFKVGWTSRGDVRIRVKEQTGTAHPDGAGVFIHLDEPAVRDDGTWFTDNDIHHVLDAAGVHRTSEVVEATLDEIRAAIVAVRTRRPYDPTRVASFGMRPEQQRAVDVTAAYFTAHASDAHPPRFLWNAKMRFGKTFTTYQLAVRMGWRRVLVLTFKPAVRDAWRDDLGNHVDFTGWQFIDRDNPAANPDADIPMVWFASFQDLLGTGAGGAVKAHNEAIHLTEWDAVVIDEYHFGAWQGAAREVCAPATQSLTAASSQAKADEQAAAAAEDVTDLADAGTPRLVAATPDTDTTADLSTADLKLTGRHFLYLSGTPFRALTDGEFNEDAIFNWTYPDEQAAKAAWDGPVETNPYAELPAMHMYTYSLTGLAAQAAADADPSATFDLSGYFEATMDGGQGRFTDPARVAAFLDMLRGKLTQTAGEKLLNGGPNPPFPYADARFTDAVQHSVWFMPTVASAHAMSDALSTHPFFRNHTVHIAAGSAAGMGADAKGPVVAMLDQAATLDRPTITLSVGKLMTGVTVAQWGSILILRSLKSPESYFQAAFRVQSPWTTRRPDGRTRVLKDTCYVFDFDPNRTLSLVYAYGTKLAGSATSKSPADEVADLLNFLPIFAFDGGRMDAIDVNAVMDWATAGTGAAMLAKRWGSPRLVDLSEAVLTKLLETAGLVDRLQQMEDFRALRTEASKIIASSKKIRDGKKAPGSGEPEDPDVAAARRAKREQVDTLRKKLLKLIQKVPVFMYLTDFREESLVDVITSLDTSLFERVTGLTIADFTLLSELGVFSSSHMNEAIWQFRLFERAGLAYLGGGAPTDAVTQVGLWDTTITKEELVAGPAVPTADPVMVALLDGYLLEVGNTLVGPTGQTAVVAGGGGLLVNKTTCTTPAAAVAVGCSDTDGWDFWALPGYGTLRELTELLAVEKPA